MDPADIKSVLFTAAQIEERVDELAERISEDYRGEKVIVVGILKGASIFMSDLVRKVAADVDIEFDFMVVSSYGSGASSSGTVSIKKDLDHDIAGCNVLIVEDILDTGLTLQSLTGILEARGPKSLEIAVLLRKDLGNEPVLEPKYLGMVTPNEFLVGYGLDYDERYRALPYIGILDERVYA